MRIQLRELFYDTLSVVTKHDRWEMLTLYDRGTGWEIAREFQLPMRGKREPDQSPSGESIRCRLTETIVRKMEAH